MKKPFSDQLEDWLKSNKPKTLMGLSDVFGEKSFAIAFLILLSIPALPAPTGGLTHVFEIVAMLLSLEVIIGRRNIWLPKRWEHLKIGKSVRKIVLPRLIKYIRKLEKISRPRLDKLMAHKVTLSIIGLTVFLFSLAAFLSPPFSGLDTLPALGVVLISLAILLDDFAILVLGYLAGIIGITLIVGFSAVVIRLTTNLF